MPIETFNQIQISCVLPTYTYAKFEIKLPKSSVSEIWKLTAHSRQHTKSDAIKKSIGP